MTEVTLTPPGPMARAKDRAAAWLAAPKNRLYLACFAGGLLALCGIVWWSSQSGSAGGDTRELRRLPARPEDIEAQRTSVGSIVGPALEEGRVIYGA